MTKFQAPAIINSFKRASCLRCILTLSNRILLEKLSISRLVKKLSSAFYGTRRFVTVLTTASHLALSGAKLNQSTPSRLYSLRVILVLPSHLHLVFQVTSFLSGFPTRKTSICFSLLRHTYYMFRPPRPPWFDHLNDICWRVQIMIFLGKQFSPASYSLSIAFCEILLNGCRVVAFCIAWFRTLLHYEALEPLSAW